MSKQWEECGCGSAEAHARYGVCSTGKDAAIYERGPDETCPCARLNAREGNSLTYYCSRCPSAAPGDVYERGGYLARCACERHTTPMGAYDVPDSRFRELLPLAREALATAGEVVPVENYRPTPETLAMWGKAPKAPPTPAAMLGEARALLLRVAEQCRAAGEERMAQNADELRREVGDAKREAEARETAEILADRECFYSERGMPKHDLGEGPEECLMCAAKRREDKR